MAFKSSQIEHLKLVTEFIGRSCCKHTIAGSGETLRYETWTRTERLGAGGFGVVYQEACSETKDVRAVKQISKSLAIRWDEVGILGQLRSNPEHFVQLIGWFEDEYDIYLAMEFLLGDLGGLLKEKPGGLSENESKSVTKQILTGLEILHKKGICHRDLKPGNILISEWAPLQVKIGGFGVSKLKNPCGNTEWRTTARTRPFMAPEIQDLSTHGQESSVYTTAVDIWSLGCLVYFMMTNTIPFPQTKYLESYIHHQSLFPPRTALAPTIPDSAVGFLASLLHHVPENRPPASQALLHSWLSTQEQIDEKAWADISSGAKLVSAPGPNQKVGTGSDAAAAAEGESATKDKPGQKNPRVPITAWRRDALQHLLVAAAASGNCKLLVQQLGKGASPMEDPSGYTPIYVAAKNGHLSIIKLLLEHGANLGVGGTHGVCALHGAARAGKPQITQYLLDKGADPSATDNEGFMAHHIAAESGATEVLQLLIGQGADIAAPDTTRFRLTALMHATRGHHLDSVRYLLDRGADISATDYIGRMAHHIAAEVGDTEVLQLLVEKGADILASGGKRGWTALIYAAFKGHLDAARYLLDRGADISATDNEGRMAHHIAVQFGATEMLQLLVEKGADILASGGERKWTALMYAAFMGYLDVARYLLDRCADISAMDNEGRMAHHIAAQFGATEVLQLLVEKGADILASGGERRWTALMYATFNSHLEAARYLLDRGVDISATDNEGRMAHHIAALSGATGVLQLLVRKGANISASAGEHRWTALMYAACKGHLYAARYLLDKDADISATDNEGRMAHHIAAQFDATEVLQLLVKNEADILALGGKRRWTALMYAAWNDSLDASRYLLDRSADVSEGALDSTLGALKLATERGHIDIVRLLLDRGAYTSVTTAAEESMSLAASQGHTEIVIMITEWFENEMSIPSTGLGSLQRNSGFYLNRRVYGVARFSDSASDCSPRRHSNSDFSPSGSNPTAGAT